MGIVCVKAFWHVWLTRTCCSAASSFNQEGLVQAWVDMAMETRRAFSPRLPHRDRASTLPLQLRLSLFSTGAAAVSAPHPTGTIRATALLCPPENKILGMVWQHHNCGQSCNYSPFVTMQLQEQLLPSGNGVVHTCARSQTAWAGTQLGKELGPVQEKAFSKRK